MRQPLRQRIHQTAHPLFGIGQSFEGLAFSLAAQEQLIGHLPHSHCCVFFRHIHALAVLKDPRPAPGSLRF